MENKDYSQLYVSGMHKAGYNEGKNARLKFASVFDECLHDEHYKKITGQAGFDHKLFCAALAQLKMSKCWGCSNDGPYNIKAFWDLTDEQVDFVIANIPEDLVGFAKGAIINLNDKYR